MEKKPVRPIDQEDGRELFDNMMHVASAGECTGMIPSAQCMDDEAESYSEIYDIPLASAKPEEKPITSCVPPKNEQKRKGKAKS